MRNAGSKQLVYYGHRYRDPDPAVQAANLARAEKRMAELQAELGDGYEVVAPWMTCARCGLSESDTLEILRPWLWAAHRVVIDRDGGTMTDGMNWEKSVAMMAGVSTEVLP